MERIGHRARSFKEAESWELQQYAQMSPDERRRVAKVLRDRYYGRDCPDVRDAIAGSRRQLKP